MMLGHRHKADKTIPGDVYDADVDRISNLPDHLLCCILSFNPTKEAAVTSVLSRRWRYLFTLIPDIDLGFNFCDSFGEYNENSYFRCFFSFISFGHRVILVRNAPSIRKFRLSIQRIRGICLPGIQTLISTALLSKVQELEIHVESKYDYTYNLSPAGAGVFMCKTLTSIKLDWPDVDLIIPDSLCLPNLKLLHFDRLRLVDEDSIKRLMQGCPLLEELKLSFTYFRYGYTHIIFEVVDISGSLRKLILHCSRAEYTVVVKSDSLKILEYGSGCFTNSNICINAPNLKFLAFHADRYEPCVPNFIQSPKSLVSAKIIVPWIGEATTCQHAFELFSMVQSVKSLELTKYSLEAFIKFGGSLPAFNNLIRLEIDTMPSCYALRKLSQSAPKIEELVLHQVAQDDRFECPSPEVLQMHFIKHLKVIQINKFFEEEYEFELVQCLLQSGKALKKMTIGGSIRSSGCERISSFKRCSQDCRIVL